MSGDGPPRLSERDRRELEQACRLLGAKHIVHILSVLSQPVAVREIRIPAGERGSEILSVQAIYAKLSALEAGHLVRPLRPDAGGARRYEVDRAGLLAIVDLLRRFALIEPGFTQAPPTRQLEVADAASLLSPWRGNSAPVLEAGPALACVDGVWIGKRLQLPIDSAHHAMGRGSSCEMLVRHDDTVSKHHASFRSLEDGQFGLVDEGSRNGTFLNGRRLQPHKVAQVRFGDILHVGASTYVVHPGAP